MTSVTDSGERGRMGAFLASEFPQASAGTARFHVLPVPYEATVSYGTGTGRGPAAILAASNQLEAYDGTSTPGEEGIYTHRPVDTDGAPPDVLASVQKRVGEIMECRTEDDGRAVPVLLGGEHAITAPAVAAVARCLVDGSGASRRATVSSGNSPGVGARAGRPPLAVVQIDAHADLRAEYDGTRLSHACVMRRIHEELGLPLVQIGVRALCLDEVVYRKRWRIPNHPPIISHDARTIVGRPVDAWLHLPGMIPSSVYLSIDVDGLDPSVIPATGTPVPGGLGWYEVLDIIEAIAAQRRVVGFDVVELAPIAGHHAADYAAAELVYRTMGIIARSPHGP